MARRYADPVEVVRRDDRPDHFLWRGRLYLVRGVLARWNAAGSWWQQPTGQAGVDDREREFWRVEAGAGRSAGTGVFDLCFDWSSGRWSLVGVAD